MSSTHIVVQPTACAFSGQAFDDCNTRVILKCGCALGSKTVLDNMNNGFVYCPLCCYAYTVKQKGNFTSANLLTADHNGAQLARCEKYEKEIELLRVKIDQRVLEDEPEMTKEERDFSWLQIEDDSDVADSSEDDFDDFTAFESTTYAILAARLAKLKQKNDELDGQLGAVNAKGKGMKLPWATDASWTLPADSDESARAEAKRDRRLTRKKQRDSLFAERESKRGAFKVVHNTHVLNKQVPRRWAKDNPNMPKPSNWEEQERAKAGWLTAAELENMDEDEQEKVTNERRQAWKSERSAVPTLYGSVARQRWAGRLYRLPRQRHYINARVQQLVGSSDKEKNLWNNRLNLFEDRAVQTQTKIDGRVLKQNVRDSSSVNALVDFFQKATKIGESEIEAEIAARVKAEEEARAKSKQEAAAAAKAEAKVKAKAEAEAKGEEFVDPDGDDEGDGEEEDGGY